MTHPPKEFKTGYRGVLLLHRTKDGALGGDQQRNALKTITSSVAEYDQAIDDFKELQRLVYPNHRIYSSVNPRNMDKAIREFKRRQLDLDYEPDQIKWEFYADVRNRFFSCVMGPTAKDGNHFLVDCDTDAEYAEAIGNIPPSDILYDYPTKKGRHLIIRASNLQLFKESVRTRIKRDDLIYIG